MCKNGCCELHPIYLLIFLTLINILIYVDRGILSAVASTLEDKVLGLGLVSTELGAVGSLFMLGYMIAGPVFAHYSQSVHPLHLISIGLFVWGLSAVGAGLSQNFWQLALARSFSGVGEASFVCLAPPYILDHAPSQRKTTWIAIFYSAIAIGYAIGYVFGNAVNTALGGWYWPFFIEATAIFPFILICIFAKKTSNSRVLHENNGEVMNICKQFKVLGSNLIFVFLVLGFSAFIFTLGALSFWGPYIIEKLYNKSKEEATSYLGIIVITTGVFGTLIGSIQLDCLMKKHTVDYNNRKITEDKLKSITTEKANLFLFVNTFIAVSVSLIGIYLNTFTWFMTGVSVAHFFIFL